MGISIFLPNTHLSVSIYVGNWEQPTESPWCQKSKRFSRQKCDDISWNAQPRGEISRDQIQRLGMATSWGLDQFCGVYLVDIIALPMGLQTPSAPLVFLQLPHWGSCTHPMVACKHLQLYLSGSHCVFQETSIRDLLWGFEGETWNEDNFWNAKK